MSIATSFAPVAASDARILILGSMPGLASLQAQRYYAHPRNAFWPIMATLLDFDTELAYEQRLQQLLNARIALWDVLQSCYRPGSLDSAIEPDSQVANDFDAFFDRHPHIDRVCFNGGKAETVFRRQVLPTLKHRDIRYTRLPSTSPAHAACSFEQKLMQWRTLIEADSQTDPARPPTDRSPA